NPRRQPQARRRRLPRPAPARFRTWPAAGDPRPGRTWAPSEAPVAVRSSAVARAVLRRSASSGARRAPRGLLCWGGSACAAPSTRAPVVLGPEDAGVVEVGAGARIVPPSREPAAGPVAARPVAGGSGRPAAAGD